MSASPEEAEAAEELPQDFAVMLTSAFDLYRRIDAKQFIAFAVDLDRAIVDHFRRPPERASIHVQVACALLPGPKKLTEVHVVPADAAVTEAERLTVAIHNMTSPEVTGGPVAFFRRGVFGGGGRPEGVIGLPFVHRHLGSETTLLDDLLMRAANVPPPSQSPWAKLRRLFRPESGPVQKLLEDDILPRLSRELNIPVIACQGRMVVGR